MAASCPVHTLLVLGGARSGKSRYAQQLAEASGLSPIYLATCAPYEGDTEMADRIARHRADRDTRWETVEAPFDLADTLADICRPDRIVLVDCLTLWLSNLLLDDRDLDEATAELIRAAETLPGPIIFVSNEVGQGIVPENALARRFRDAQGRLNQAMAQACDGVVLVTAGLPLRLKPGPAPEIEMRPRPTPTTTRP